MGVEVSGGGVAVGESAAGEESVASAGVTSGSALPPSVEVDVWVRKRAVWAATSAAYNSIKTNEFGDRLSHLQRRLRTFGIPTYQHQESKAESEGSNHIAP